MSGIVVEAERAAPHRVRAPLVAGLVVALATWAAPQDDGPRGPPSRLGPAPLDSDAQLPLALWQARAGDLEGAAARLERLLLALPDGDGRAPLERELGRLTKAREVRDAWLATLAAEGGRLFVEREDKRIAIRVEGYADGVVRLGRNRFGLERLEVSGEPLAALLGEARDLPADAPGWLGPYALLLGGSERWERGLDAEDPAGAALLADAPRIRELLPQGRVWSDLAALEQAAPGADAALAADVAAEVVERLERLVADPLARTVLGERRGALGDLARRAFAALYDAEPGRLPLQGAVERLDRERLRITYAFDRVEEADDFTLDSAAMADWHATMTPVPKAPEDSYFIVKQGAFFGDGQLVYRHALEFGPGVRVRYTMRYIPREGDTLDVGVVMIGLADNGQQGFVAASEFGDVYAIDPATYFNERKLYEGERLVGINQLYEAEARLEPDGERAVLEAWRDGKLRNELDAGPHRRGGVFLFVHSPRIIAIETLTLEGVPEPASLARLRERWIDERVAALGLAR